MPTRRTTSTAIGLIGGVALDRLLADPTRGHPVAQFGRASSVVEQRVYRDSRWAGIGFTIACSTGAVGAALAAHRLTRGPAGRAALVAAATWAVLGAESLQREAATIAHQLEAGDLDAARTQLTHLVGRDPAGLDAGEIARAAVESVAENTSDAVVAPLLWGAVAGVPGLIGYRAVNTLDAMVGHKSQRYRNFGWASARLDDLANLVPARVTAALVVAVSEQPGRTWRIMTRDARRHPSPNAGWCEAAFAGALDVRLGGTNVYAGRIEERPFLGDGKPVRVADLARAAALQQRVTLAAAGLAAGLAVVLGRVRR